jgi:hypothetical protein
MCFIVFSRIFSAVTIWYSQKFSIFNYLFSQYDDCIFDVLKTELLKIYGVSGIIDSSRAKLPNISQRQKTYNHKAFDFLDWLRRDKQVANVAKQPRMFDIVQYLIGISIFKQRGIILILPTTASIAHPLPPTLSRPLRSMS